MQLYALFIGAVPLQVFGVIVVAVLAGGVRGRSEVLLVLVPLVVGIAFDLVFVAAIRFSLRQAAVQASIWRIVLLISVPLGGAVFTIAAPLTLGSWTIRLGHGLGAFVGGAVLTDIFDVVIGLAVVTCGLLFAFYHAQWPALQRPLYALTRLKEPRRYVLLLGAALILLGLAPDLAAVKAVAKVLLGWAGLKIT